MSHGKTEYERKIARSEYTPRMPGSYLTSNDLWAVYDRFRPGEKIRFRYYDGYFMKQQVGRPVEGTIIDKYPNYCVLDVKGHREAFVWFELQNAKVVK